MFIQKTNVEGLAIIESRLLKDARGYFFESFSQREFEEKVRKVNFVQDNESMSSYGVMRGLHFQKPVNKAILSENDTKHLLSVLHPYSREQKLKQIRALKESTISKKSSNAERSKL